MQFDALWVFVLKVDVISDEDCAKNPYPSKAVKTGAERRRAG
jgi:hypothetical protein